MKKGFLFIILYILICLPVLANAASSSLQLSDTGEDIVKIQNRLNELGYLNTPAAGVLENSTYQAAIQFCKTAEHPEILDSNFLEALFAKDASRASMNTAFKRISGPALQYSSNEYGRTLKWADAATVFPIGKTVTIIDFNTKREFTVKRTGGVNHAHVEPLTEADTNVFLKCFGGDFTWEKRACLVILDGKKYAASLFGSPNASDTIAENGLTGSLCLFFNGSTTDIGNTPDAEHQERVLYATKK